MKTETITQIYLTADEGMYLTNGNTIVKTAILPLTADPAEWWEITEEEGNAILNPDVPEDIPPDPVVE